MRVVLLSINAIDLMTAARLGCSRTLSARQGRTNVLDRGAAKKGTITERDRSGRREDLLGRRRGNAGCGCGTNEDVAIIMHLANLKAVGESRSATKVWIRPWKLAWGWSDETLGRDGHEEAGNCRRVVSAWQKGGPNPRRNLPDTKTIRALNVQVLETSAELIIL
jgi:hypothetical protein